MKPLTKESIELVRASLLTSEWCGFSKRGTVHGICDLALKGLDVGARSADRALPNDGIARDSENLEHNAPYIRAALPEKFHHFFDNVLMVLARHAAASSATTEGMGFTPAQATCILLVRDALLAKDIDEAWHWLYTLDSKQVPHDPFNPWSELEEISKRAAVDGRAPK